jgi:hypothetical protein
MTMAARLAYLAAVAGRLVCVVVVVAAAAVCFV